MLQNVTLSKDDDTLHLLKDYNATKLINLYIIGKKDLYSVGSPLL